MIGPALAGWQSAVAASIITPAKAPAGGSTGTAAERVGWPVTVALYRQWRVFRLMSLAPLTVALLGPRADELVDDYLAADRGSTSYAARDAAGFLRHLRASCPPDPWLAEMSALELAFLTARRPACIDPQPLPGMLVRSWRASLLQVPYDVLSLMRWASGHGEQPVADPGPVLVAPKLPGWVRPASAAECRLWQQLVEPAATDEIRLRYPAELAALHAAGAIVI